MEHSFWAERWDENEIRFHEGRVNPNLAKHFPGLGADETSHVLVPLCGKAVDLVWLAERVGRVTGVEFVEKAVVDFFVDNGLEPQRVEHEHAIEYRAGNITMLCADVFDLALLGPELLPSIDYIWDRAALVALGPEARGRYARTLRDVAGSATMLLNSFDYDQSVMPGPPHSVPEAEVRNHYGDERVELISADDVVDRMQFTNHTFFNSSVYVIAL